MTTELAVAPAAAIDVIEISPENLEVANCYLQNQDIRAVASDLDISPSSVTEILGRREVRAYIDSVFMDVGYNNRFKLRSALDAVIMKKFQDMEEAGTGSSKDIADLLALSHKMSMEHFDREIELEKLRQKRETNIRSQVNVQINDNAGSNYGALLSKLLDSTEDA